MALDIIAVTPGHSDATVVLVSDVKAELKTREATEYAMRAARGYLGKCGFNQYGNSGVMRPDGTVMTEAEMVTARTFPEGSKFTQELNFKQSI